MTYILIFNSVHRVMRAEKLLKNANLHSKTIPVPRKLSSDCGLAIKISNINVDEILKALEDEGPFEIYLEKLESYERIYEKKENFSN